MPAPASSLSVAIQGVADFLNDRFADITDDVLVTVDTPQRAQEKAKDSTSDILNLFVYRLSASGFHAASGPADPLFLRAHALITAFPRGQGANVAPDIDLRVLGHAVRVLAGAPVIPVVLPGAAQAGSPGDFRNGPVMSYRLDAVMQAPGMEELNHIWTTQGGELAYRLSAAYDFALIPVEPLTRVAPAPPVRGAVVEVTPYAPARPTERVYATLGPEPAGQALGSLSGTAPPPVGWVPLILFAEGGSLGNARTVAAGTATVSLAAVGPPGQRLSIAIDWVRAGGAVQAQTPQGRTLGHHRIDDPAAVLSVALDAPAEGDRATITARPGRTSGSLPLADAPAGNALTLTVGPAGGGP